MAIAVRLVTETTRAGGKRQYWRAVDFERDYLGTGRKRISAIRDLRPAEERIRHGRQKRDSVD